MLYLNLTSHFLDQLPHLSHSFWLYYIAGKTSNGRSSSRQLLRSPLVTLQEAAVYFRRSAIRSQSEWHKYSTFLPLERFSTTSMPNQRSAGGPDCETQRFTVV